MRAKLALLTGALLALPNVALAQATSAAPGSPMTRDASLDRTIERGKLLFAYDRAAWLGTDDALVKLKSGGRQSEMAAEGGGWIVEGDRASPRLTFFANWTAPRAIYRASFTDGGTRLVESMLVPKGDAAVLTPLQLRLIAAQGAARAALTGAAMTSCSNRLPNSVVVPPAEADGPVSVYLMTPQVDHGVFPIGGHVRIDIAPTGRAGPVQRFANSCIAMDMREKGSDAIFVVTHLLGPMPTEMHVFTALTSARTLAVATPDKMMWVITPRPGGEITIERRALDGPATQRYD